MVFASEEDFERALIKILATKGWDSKVIDYPTEQDLLDNWAKILFDNNSSIDRLNNHPLTKGEMSQIIEQVQRLATPLKLNNFINGKTVSIKRDNPEDRQHFGKEISLKIYDRREIAGGSSRYQIARQPQFTQTDSMLQKRRGDLMLLINGMPVIHIELKKSDVPATQAAYQIQKYSRERAFSGIFALVQIFVAMNPDQCMYFANPGPDGVFNSDFYFNWANFDNEPIHNWKDIASTLLSIPMAHQMIGFYTVPDSAQGSLKVLRSYQYYAANAISDRVSKSKWEDARQRGGYIWHTTGSGKTLTSFKSAELIANSGDADKVVFLTDRIELGTQSLHEYRGFASDAETIQSTESTYILVNKLKSKASSDTLIVTSIQKMSNIKTEEGGLNQRDIELMAGKRIVFIVDEAHRSTFGEMLATIKETFPRAIFFGFTGTPIHDENQKKDSTTSSVFGNELHRYSIADGIRDRNVLGFDATKVLTFRDRDVRELVALEQARAASVLEALADPEKERIYYRFVSELEMAEVENYFPKSQYQTEEHQKMVVRDIKENWDKLSRQSRFHAILATSSIKEAIDYYRLVKKEMPGLRCTALFDPSIDNTAGFAYKEDGLVEILRDYNARYGKDFNLASHPWFKKDVSARLAHKAPYLGVEREAEKQLELLIVVDQMLTGFDSRWVNTLYLDKLLEFEAVIQAFSRTNRLFGPEKPFGSIRYYRRPHRMEKNIGEAVKLYSGDRAFGLFVEKLPENIRKLNSIHVEIKALFKQAGVEKMESLPEDTREKAKFASLFNSFNRHLEAARVQGLKWEQADYQSENADGSIETISMNCTENDYLILVQRYKELEKPGQSEEEPIIDVPFEIEGHLVEINTERIDSDYMNSRFEKYYKLLDQPDSDPGLKEEALNALHQSFALLTQEDQKFANIFLNDIHRGDIVLEAGKSFRDYVTIYKAKAYSDRLHEIATELGLDEEKLKNLKELKLTSKSIDEYGRFSDLKDTVVAEKAAEYFTKLHGRQLKAFEVKIEVDKFLRGFLLE